MAKIYATDTFDEELLEPEIFEQVEPLVMWLNENMQNIVSALQSNLGDTNLATRTVQVQAYSGVKQTVKINGPVSHVAISRISSQPDSNVLIKGFNWWPTSDGFEFIAEWTENAAKTIYLRVEFNV